MPGNLSIPHKRWLEHLDARAAAEELTNYLAIERWANYLLPAAFELREAITGNISATVLFPRYYLQVPTKLHQVIFSTTATTTGASDLTIYKNGVSQIVLTLPTGDDVLFALGRADGLDISYNPGDYYNAELTTVGTGLAGISIQQIFEP